MFADMVFKQQQEVILEKERKQEEKEAREYKAKLAIAKEYLDSIKKELSRRASKGENLEFGYDSSENLNYCYEVLKELCLEEGINFYHTPWYGADGYYLSVDNFSNRDGFDVLKKRIHDQNKKLYLDLEHQYSIRIADKEDILKIREEIMEKRNEKELRIKALVNAAYRNGLEGDFPETFGISKIQPTMADVITHYCTTSCENMLEISHRKYKALREKEKSGIKAHVKNLKLYNGMLIVVDMVNGFAKEGSLADPKIAEKVPRQIELIKEARDSGDLVVFIKDTHEMDSVEHKRFKGALHCVRGTGEEELIDDLKEFENEQDTISIAKNSTSYMEAPEFRKLIEDATSIERVDVVGCCTDICDFNGTMGLANYLDQWNRDVRIRVHEDAIATFLEDDRQKYVDAAKLLMEQQGIQLVKKDRFF